MNRRGEDAPGGYSYRKGTGTLPFAEKKCRADVIVPGMTGRRLDYGNK